MGKEPPEHVVLVAGPESQAQFAAAVLRSRGFSAWSDRCERVLNDRVSLAWADLIVVMHDGPLSEADRNHLGRIATPKMLVSSVKLSAQQRVDLIEVHGFEYVIDWPATLDCIAAFVERALHRGALPLRFTGRG